MTLSVVPAHESWELTGRFLSVSRTWSPTKSPTFAELRSRYRPDARYKCKESERFKCYTYDELIARDKVSLDLVWLRDESLEDTDNLPPPEVLVGEIAEDLQSALTEIQALAESLSAATE